MSEGELVFMEEYTAKILSGVLALFVMLVFVPIPAIGERYKLPMIRPVKSTKAGDSDERRSPSFPASRTVKAESISKIGFSAIYLANGSQGDDGIGVEAYMRHFETPDLSLNFKVGYIGGLGGPWFDISMTPIEFTALYHVATSSESQLYFGAGIGGYFFNTDQNHFDIGIEINDCIGYHLLVGMEKQINKDISFFGEIRHLHLRPRVHLTGDAPVPWSLGPNAHWMEATESFKEDFGGKELVLGIMWKF